MALLWDVITPLPLRHSEFTYCSASRRAHVDLLQLIPTCKACVMFVMIRCMTCLDCHCIFCTFSLQLLPCIFCSVFRSSTLNHCWCVAGHKPRKKSEHDQIATDESETEDLKREHLFPSKFCCSTVSIERRLSAAASMDVRPKEAWADRVEGKELLGSKQQKSSTSSLTSSTVSSNQKKRQKTKRQRVSWSGAVVWQPCVCTYVRVCAL